MNSSASKALAIQSRVIQALILRETKTRFGNLRLGYAWALVEPMMHVAIFVAIYQLLDRDTASGIPVILFLITGITPFLAFRNTMQQTSSAVAANKSLLTFPQVTLFDLAFTRVWLEAATIIIVFVLLLFVSQYMDQTIRFQDLLGVCFAFLMILTLGAGVGMLLCAISPSLPSISKIQNPFLARPLFFTSGLFFTADMLPTALREPLLYNPLLHLIEYLRSSFFYEYHSTHYDLGYAGAWTFGLFAVGFAALRINRSRLLNA